MKLAILNISTSAFDTMQVSNRALARILKLPVIFERMTVQNGLKLCKMVRNYLFFAGQKQKLPVKMVCIMGPS